jgi:hypothetical protein
MPVSIWGALVAVWRNLADGRDLASPRYDEGIDPDSDAEIRRLLQVQSKAQAQALMNSILPRLPQHLHGALEHAVQRSHASPTDLYSLMNEISGWRTGLGIANERGGAPSEEDQLLHARMGELERWLDRELDHPAGTQYAVVRRAAERLARGSQDGRGAE